jgi:hypothetical protein
MLVLLAFNTKKVLTYPEVLELTGAAFIFARFLLHLHLGVSGALLKDHISTLCHPKVNILNKK